jgi:hypothetical protein
MSQEQDDPRELLIASLLKSALEGKSPEEPQPALDEALGTAAYIKNTQEQALLSALDLQALASEIQLEATARLSVSPEEAKNAEQLRLALEGNEAEENNALSEALSAASYLKGSNSALGEDLLIQLGREVEQEAKSKLAESSATPEEERAADVLRHVLEGNTRVIASEQIQREVSAAMATATYLKNTAAPQLLSPAELSSIQKEVTQEAQLRSQRRKRIAFFGGASLLAIAASAIFLLAPIFNPPKREKIDAQFPKLPTLTQEILPGSDPLERLDPMYEAGLRSLREARFLGAHYASQNAH